METPVHEQANVSSGAMQTQIPTRFPSPAGMQQDNHRQCRVQSRAEWPSLVLHTQPAQRSTTPDDQSQDEDPMIRTRVGGGPGQGLPSIQQAEGRVNF
jgi:hypothetical protein